MPKGIKKQWTLTVTLNGGVNAPSVTTLNSGVLNILGQHKPKSTDTFDMFVANLTSSGVNPTAQLVAGAIDEHDNVGFIFLSDGTATGIQYIFQAGTVLSGGTQISNGTIFGPLNPDDDGDLGTWSAQSGGGVEGDDEDDEEGDGD